MFLQGKDAPLEVCKYLSFVTGTASLLNSGAGEVSTARCKDDIVFAFLNQIRAKLEPMPCPVPGAV